MEEEGRTQQRWHAEAEARRGDEVRELRLRSEAQLSAMRSQLAQLEVSFPRPPSSLPWPPWLLGVASCGASFVLRRPAHFCVSVVSLFISRVYPCVCLACLCICVLTCAHVCVAAGKQVSTRAFRLSGHAAVKTLGVPSCHSRLPVPSDHSSALPRSH